MEAVVPTRVGLLGWPVGHSRSPAMHNAAFQALGLNWEYLLLPVPPERLGDAIRGLRALGFAGANVTVPHKQAAMSCLDTVTIEARAIGAVNTIVNHGGALTGYNTDALGFLRALRDAGFDARGCRALVLGAGGAARAVVYALLAARARVTIANRTIARGRGLADEIGALFHARVVVVPLDTPVLARALRDCDLLVNTTSVGMARPGKPEPLGSPLDEELELRADMVVNDLVYAPLETPLLRRARAAGARVVDGLGMLVHQGAAAFELWTGHKPSLDLMRVAALQVTA